MVESGHRVQKSKISNQFSSHSILTLKTVLHLIPQSPLLNTHTPTQTQTEKGSRAVVRPSLGKGSWVPCPGTSGEGFM
jgi:hypothetical protein